MEYSRRILSMLTLLLVFVSLLYIVERVYKQVAMAYIGLMAVEEYSYMLTLAPLVIVLFTYTLLKYFEPVGLSLERLLVYIMLVSTSLSLYLLADKAPQDTLILKILALVMVIWAFTVLFFRPRHGLPHVAVLILLLLLVPIPRGIIDPLSQSLSVVAGKVAAIITGTEMSSIGGRTIITVVDSGGFPRQFEISHACSGIISLLSVLAITPLIIYIVLTAQTTRNRKIATILLSILSATVVVFIGNVLRLAIILWATMHVNYKTAMTIFHQTPSIIYSAIAVVIVFLIINRLMPKPIEKTSQSTRHENKYDVGIYRPRTSWVLAVLVLLATALVYVSVAQVASLSMLTAEVTFIPSMPTFIKNVTHIVFNDTKVKILSDMPIPSLTTILGSTITKRIILEYNGVRFDGYVEVAETPARFHGWYVCLIHQGYRILRSWTDQGNVTINYMLVEKNKRMWLLGYSTYAYPVSTGNETEIAYVRISLFKVVSTSNYGEMALILKELFDSVNIIKQNQEVGLPVSYHVVVISNILIILNMVLLIMVPVKRAWPNILAVLRRLK